MTPDNLAEIREQHIPFEMPDGAILCEWCVDPWPCDSVTLLAEVDRLTAMLDTSEGKQEVSEGLWAEWTTGERLSYGMGYRRGLAANAERARIRAAVEDFPHNTWTSAQARERVLAAIDGEAT